MMGVIYIYTSVILFQLALVAEGTQYVKDFEQLQEELGLEDLIFMTQKPIHNNKSYGGPTTTLPNVGITTHEPNVANELVYEEEWLLPGLAAEEDILLNRDKRAVEASGDGAPELNACFGVDNTEGLVASTSSTYNDFKTATETAIFDACTATVPTLSSVEVLSVDVDNSVINFKLVFPSTTDTPNSAQCLRDIQEQGSITIGSVKFLITKDILIENGANVLVAVICELCTAQQECIKNVIELYFCGTTDLYSTSSSDSSLPKEDDAIGTVTTPSEIPIGSSVHNEFYISSNGFLSLVETPGPTSISLDSVQFDIMAVAWADLNLELNGDVFYQVHSNTENSAETEAVLTRASSDVQNFAPKSSFEATTVIVVTWKEIARLGGTNTQHATFQLVLASNGIETYALYFYGDNSWAVTSDVVIGFRNNQGSTTQYTDESSINDLKSMKGNTASNGIWIYKVGEVDINHDANCKSFHAKEAKSKKLYQDKNVEVPNCPCSKGFLNEKFVEQINDDNRVCYAINTLGIYETYSRLCCYEKSTDQFIESGEYAGSLLKYNPITNEQQYNEEDFAPWNDCCVQTSHCNLFRQVRPIKACSTFANETLVFGFGDPHIATADGFAYTFNGLGEFTFLQIGTFVIQMRAVKVTDAQGNKLAATVFGGFVVSDGSGGTTQVELSASFDQLVLFVNGKDVTGDFYAKEDYLYVLPNTLSLRRSGTHSVDIVNKNGVTLRLKLAQRMLDVGFSIPKTFSGQVEGLVGNFDGDKTNDITFKDGRTLPSTATDKEVFEAGKSWALTETQSLFIYQNGLTYSDYNDPSFSPAFASDFTAQQLTAAANVCGGTDKQFCIYDYTLTGDSSLALYTKDFNSDSQKEISALENETPQITVDTPQISATVNKETTFTLTTSDGNNDLVTVTVVNKPETGFDFNAATGVVKWTPGNNNITSMRFQAEDSKQALSPLLIIDITLCSLCNGKGTCHGTETRNSPATNYFRLLKCVCVNGFEGEDCETESNGCQYNPCDPLQTCTDKPGELATGVAGYTCSACPSGYTSTNPQKCQDINECSDNTICGTGGTCSNVPGSYKCTCGSGYRLVGLKCQDIDECFDRTHNCDQICENTDGGFTCDCEDGFTNNGGKCTKATTSCSISDCEYGCKVINGSDTCFCPATKVLNADNKTCSDFDECSVFICQQKCTNKVPGFTCSCQDGFKVAAADVLSCEACTGLSYGSECSQTCDCNGRGSCDPVLGCQCSSTWTGPDCTTDIDECTVNPNICPAGLLCRNLPGLHECYCPDGYKQVNNECKDVDECTATMGICTGSNEVCVNNVGSYTCVCDAGFLRNKNNNACDDVDECTSGIHGCDQICENNIGGFNCRCNRGFRIKNDRKTCENDPSRDPCANFAPANCEYGCKEENNLPVCFCQKGYVLGADGKSCVDVNECDGSHGCSDSCLNAPGSFKCTCPDYKKLENDGKTCIACLSSEWGTKCEKTCDCSTVGSQECVKETGCKCKTGWTGDKCDQDQDECGITGQCKVTGSDCLNTPGSYQCNCKNGYQLSSDKSMCEDTDECSLTAKVCEHSCNNNNGSYYCSCEDGFTLNAATNKCDDIDECSIGKSNCEQNCKNTVGSFLCECNEGYTIHSDRKSCTADTACDAGHGCQQNCAKISNSDTCGCNEGYNLNADEKNCDAINRCDSNPCINGSCSSVPPVFTCSCAPGLQLKNDAVTCEACPEGYYGSDCSSACLCVSSNTKSCNKVTGVCTCNDGWNGDTCSVNIDECSDSTICNSVANSKCEDSDGSFNCKCTAGYVKVNSICEACPEGKYGSDCSSACLCVASNTKSCNKVTGVCTCNDGWNGDTCSVNIDECSDSTICNSVANSKCEDSDGSFNCKCNAGYVKVNDKCEDQNECLLSSLNTCNEPNQVCSNTDGTFECNCEAGYLKNGNNCKDIDECMVSNDGCEIYCNNTAGSSFCSCPQGQQLNARDLKTCYVTADETRELYQIRLNINNKNDIVNNPSLFAHEKLKKDIGDAVLKHIQSVGNSGVNNVNVTNLSVGSIIADMEVIAVQFQSLNASVLSKQLYDLLQGETLVIDGSSTKVLGITKDGITLTSSSSQCEILKEVKSCDSKTEICEVQSDKPVCRPVSETSNQDLALVIGLSVGIPLAFLLISGLTCCICFCVKRNRNQSQSSDRAGHSEPRDPFMSVFSGEVPKRGGWAASRYGLYSPDTLSAASQASSDSDGKLIRGRPKPGRMDFNDSAWHDNRSFSNPSGPQGPHQGPQDGQANFSWEHMFRALEPMRNFEIQRPNIHASPVYPGRGRRPDSMA